MELIVTEPFGGYARGTIISDPVEVADILAGEAALNVLRIPTNGPPSSLTSLKQAVDGYGHTILGAIPFSTTVNAMVFDGAGTKTQTIPPGANFVGINASSGTDYYVELGASDGVPAGDISDGSGPCMNPELRQLHGESEISVSVAQACVVTLSYYR
jgi:hypothetical protein